MPTGRADAPPQKKAACYQHCADTQTEVEKKERMPLVRNEDGPEAQLVPSVEAR